MRMLIMGAPGSGKGTQAESLVKRLSIPSISTGDMLRSAIAEGTETGKQAGRYIKDGKLVPDEVIIGIVIERIGREDCKAGYMLDGFPRTLGQAEAMAKEGIDIDAALFLDVPDEVIMKRLGGRRVCSCGSIYHVVSKPSSKGDVCEVCGKPLTVREDDKPETIAKRLEIYHVQTKPVIDYYAAQGKLLTVDGTRNVEETTELVLSLIGRG